jgi:hypothetical protein
MNAQEHARVLAISHLVYGIISAVSIIAVAVTIVATIGFSAALRFIFPEHSQWLLAGILLVEIAVAGAFLLITLALALPFIATGYGLFVIYQLTGNHFHSP